MGIPMTPRLLSTSSTISSSNIIQNNIEQSRNNKTTSEQIAASSSSSSSSSILSTSSSPSSFQNVFEKLQSFRVSLDATPHFHKKQQHKQPNNDTFNASIPSNTNDIKLEIPNSTRSNIANLSYESQIIANIPSMPKMHKRKNPKIKIRKSQKLDLAQFLSLPSPPRTSKKQISKRTVAQILPFHNLYKHQMKNILNEKKESQNKSLPHYYYTSPSVISDAPTIPSHLLMNLTNTKNERNESLQDAFKRHRQSVDLNKGKKKKGKMRLVESDKSQSYDGDNEWMEVTNIQKKKKQKKMEMTSLSSSLIVSGHIINNLVRFSSISP